MSENADSLEIVTSLFMFRYHKDRIAVGALVVAGARFDVGV